MASRHRTSRLTPATLAEPAMHVERASLVDAVVFDFYGTLIPSTPETAWRQQAHAIAEVLGADGDDVHEAFVASYPMRMVGALGGVEQTVESVARRLGLVVTPEQVHRASHMRRTLHRQLLTPRPDAVSTLVSLRDKGLRVGVVSDCSAELPEEWGGLELSRSVDVAVFSSIERLRKPDRRLFQACVRRLGVAADRSIYVADGVGQELAAATAQGMRAYCLDTMHDDIDARPLPDPPWRGGRLARLADVLDLV